MNSVYLLDANVLIALATPSHSEHRRAAEWFHRRARLFATCPITQGALVRFYMRNSIEKSISGAKEVLARVTANPRHSFWPDDLPYSAIIDRGIVGHRQITDAYLAALTANRGGRLATMDTGMVQLHSTVAELI